MTVDFAARRLTGTATLDVDAKPGSRAIILDDKGLEIVSIADSSGKPLAYSVGTADPILGAPLTIDLGEARQIVITYKSAPDSGALQWLAPQQTAGKKQPYLFSQGQAIENRSWIPTQDSPGIRQSWEAKIRVPEGLTAVMSAPGAAPPVTANGKRLFSYRMEHPVALYLIAIAVGDLRSASSGGAPGCGPNLQCSTLPPPSLPTARKWSAPPKRSTAPTAGATTT